MLHVEHSVARLVLLNACNSTSIATTEVGVGAGSEKFGPGLISFWVQLKSRESRADATGGAIFVFSWFRISLFVHFAIDRYNKMRYI